MAVILLGLEAPLWLGSLLVLMGPGLEGDIVLIIAGALAALSLVAIFLLERAPRRAVLLGLGLQSLLFVYGLGTTFVFLQLLGLVDIAFSIVAALCLAAVAIIKAER